MQDELTRDTYIDKNHYQLSKMTALVASRIHGWLLNVAADTISKEEGKQEPDAAAIDLTPEQRADAIVEVLWLRASNVLSEEAITKIQNYALQTCGYFQDADVAIPIIMRDGRIAAPGLANDPVVISNLIRQSLQFNISPFFIVYAPKAA